MFTRNAPGGLPYPRQPFGINSETQTVAPIPVGMQLFDLPPPPLPPPRSLWTWTQGVPSQLLGQDTFYGAPGQPLANTDWPLPIVARQIERTLARNPQIPVQQTLIAVPNVVGLTQAAATTALTAAGFVVAILTTYSSTVALNVVISESPAAGSLQPSGLTITLVVSLGPIPGIGTHPLTWSADGNFFWSADGFMSWTADGYEAFSEGAYAIKLAQAGYNVGTITYVFSQTDPLGTVMATIPQPFTNAPLGSSINLIVSNGPAQPATTATVPNVVGKYYYDAQLTLLGNALLIAPPVFVLSNTVLPSYVISQSIAAGAVVGVNTQVVITVSGFQIPIAGGGFTPEP